jgi:signal transduction histidine kinase
MNLLINSFEAINSNNGKIEVILDEKEEDVEVLIIDNGCGIKKEIMNKIFDPFFTTKIKGTGLGLSIVLSIVEEHKGKVRVESEEGKGTKVSVLLPKKRVLNEVFNGNH